MQRALQDKCLAEGVGTPGNGGEITRKILGITREQTVVQRNSQLNSQSPNGRARPDPITFQLPEEVTAIDQGGGAWNTEGKAHTHG